MDLVGKSINSKYEVIKKIGEGGMSKVYLAIPYPKKIVDSNKHIAIKFLKSNILSKKIEDRIRFQNEMRIIKALEHPDIIKAFESDEWNGNRYIVEEYFPGLPLSIMIRKGEYYDMNALIKLIIRIAKAIAYIHSARIIHRDLKPSNILIEKIKKNIKIIDFGLAHLFELSNLQDPDNILGTFGYMSPEQCGAIRKPITERSDLYSLGIIFYELATRQLPYVGETISSIIHQHIAKTPIKPRFLNPDIPEIIESIILKLIEKEPENRYDSANTLIKDLKKYIEGYKSFKIAQNDKKRLNTALFIGRELEIDILNKEYEKIKEKKQGDVILISGESGIGKSYLLEHWQSRLSNNTLILKGHILEQEFTPYSSFNEIINDYIKHFKNYPKEKKEFIKQEIKKDLGYIAKEIELINPLIKEITGKIADLPEIETSKELKRFTTAIARFFNLIAKIEGHCIIIIENIQWMDQSGINLLSFIVNAAINSPLFIIATLKKDITNENNNSILMNNKTIYDLFTPSRTIELRGLTEKQHRQLISEMIGTGIDNIIEISDIIFEKSRGNPYYSIKVLKEMVAKDILIINNNNIDINREKLKTFELSDEITEVVVKNLNYLTKKEKSIIQNAAILGRKFTIDTLIAVSTEFTAVDIVATVDNAMSLHILGEVSTKNGEYIFFDQKIKKIITQDVSEDKKRNIHSIIADKIENSNPYIKEKMLYEIFYHYKEAGNKDKILETAFLSGEKAKKSNAYELAAEYFNEAKTILEEKGLSETSEWFKAAFNTAYSCHITGRNEKAIKIYSEIYRKIKDPKEKIQVAIEKTRIYFEMGNFEKCEEEAALALNLLTEKIPLTKCSTILSILWLSIKNLIYSILPQFLLKQRKVNTEKYEEIIKIYRTLSWAYILTDITKFVRSVLRMLNLSERWIGQEKATALSRMAFGSVLMGIPLFNFALKYHKKALFLCKKLHLITETAMVSQYIAFCFQWKGDYTRSNYWFNTSAKIYKKIGDLKETGMSINGLFHNAYFIGEYEKAMKYNKEYTRIAHDMRDAFGIIAGKIYESRVLTEIGEYIEAEKKAKEALNLSKDKKNWILFCTSNIDLGRTALEQKDFDKAIYYLSEAKRIYEKNNFIRQYTVFLYTLYGEAILGKYIIDKSLTKKNKSFLQLIEIKKAGKKALKSTSPWKSHFAGALRLNAELYSYIGKTGKAEQLFKKAIKIASQYSRKYELAKTYESYSTFLQSYGKYEKSLTEASKGYTIYRDIGNKIKSTNLEIFLGIRREDTAIERLANRQRFSSIIKVSQDISSILKLDELLSHIILKSVEVTGAGSGYLFIEEENTLKLKASYSLIGSSIFPNDLIMHVYKNRKKIIAFDASNDIKLINYSAIRENGIKSMLILPIIRFDKCVGVCYLDNTLSRGVFSLEDAEILDIFMTQAAIMIENASLYKNLENKVAERTAELTKAYEKLNTLYSRLKDDLSLAQKIQKDMLPCDISEINKYKFTTRYQPMTEVGGDIYDITQISSSTIRIFLADAIGHGVQAALITMIIKETYNKFKMEIKDPAILMKKINESFKKTFIRSTIYFTAVITDIHKDTGKIFFTSGGHPEQFAIINNRIKSLKGSGKLIGIFSNLDFSVIEEDFLPGDKLFLFTDGITEEFSTTGEEFTEKRLKNIIVENKDLSADKIINKILSSVQSFKGEAVQNDDITLIGIEYIKNN